EMGEVARDAAILRLTDSRWYFVRNILIILRTMNDQVVVRFIRRLIPKHHPRIRMELLRVLLHFHDPEGDRLLLQDLGSQDAGIRLNALQVAGKSRHSEVYKALIETVNKPGWSSQEIEAKRAAVAALAEIGNPQAIGNLEKILKSASIFNRGSLNKLKVEI